MEDITGRTLYPALKPARVVDIHHSLGSPLATHQRLGFRRTWWRGEGLRRPWPEQRGYLAEFATQSGQWTEVTVPLSSLTPEFRGQKLSGPPLDRSRIEEIGISLSDGKPGAFALEIDWIKAG